MLKAYFTILISFCTFSLIAQDKTYWSPEQVIKLKNITAVRVSPNGKQVAYSVRQAIMTDDRSEFINQIYLSDVPSTHTTLLTKGDKNNSNPRWSPDGKSIAFLSNRDGKTNLYVLPLEGGEADKLTDVKTAVSDFKWSPDGKAIAYIMTDAPSDPEEKKKKAKDDWYFMEEEFKQGRIYVLWLNEKDSTGKQKVLKATSENRHIASLDWSPDSKWIVFAHALSPGVNDNVYSDIARVNVSTGKVENVVNTSAGETDPHFSPDGKFIAYWASDEAVTWGGKGYLRILPVNGGKEITLMNTPNEPTTVLGWSADSKSFFLYEPYHTTAKIFRLSTDGKTVSEWTSSSKNMITSVDLNETGTSFGMIIQNAAVPGDAYVSATTAFAPVKVSNVNPEIASYPRPRTELISWKSPDGKEVEGLLTYPLNYEAGKKYPFILNIHGGPAGVFSETFIASNSGAYPIAALAEKGIFILRPNPRGSTGYGVDFRLANQRDWGGADYLDLMSGVDYVISRGLIDSTRMGVMGWSYGGFMSSWVIGHTNRFKAASIGAPVVDLAAQNMTDDIAGFLPSYMKKQPWEDWDVYNTHSPLRYIQNVNTPVLLQQGDADIRVPFSQGVMLFHALKRRNVPVRFLVLPRQPHGPTEPKMILKINQTNVAWMENYLLGKQNTF